MRAADAALLIVTLMLAWSFYRAHKNPMLQLDLFDLVMSDGRVSRIAVAFMVTLCVTSWIMVRLTLDGKLTEGYFTGYGVMWIAPIVAKLFSTNQQGTMTETSVTTSTKVTP
jgi:uncharacterized membrane protein